MTALLLDWKAACEAGLARAGGKGSQLGALAELGVPVPPGFVIEAAAGAARRRGDAIPDAVAAALSQELDRRGWRDRPLAVRSSAVMEDSARASFAGVYRSCLNVRGLEAALKAVRDIWDCAWEPAAVAYRQRLSMADLDAGMAIVVMPLLPAVASGIAFTCDPISGREDQSVIHASWGLGEALVGGQTEGDEYRLQRSEPDDTPTLIDRRLGRKARTTVAAAEGGTALRDTPAEQAARWVLSGEQAVALAALVQDAAYALDYTSPHYDLEWVWDGARFWIVQARPVTRRGRYTYPALAHQPSILSRMNSREVLPEPLSALEWSSSRSVLRKMLSCTLELAGYPALPGIERTAIRQGRLYFDTSVLQWEAFDSFGFAPQATTEMLGGHQPEIAAPEPTLRQRAARVWRSLRYLARCVKPRRRAKATLRRAREQAAEWLASSEPVVSGEPAGIPKPADSAGPADSLELARRLHARSNVVRSAKDLFFLQVSSASFYPILLELAEKHCPGEGRGITAALLAGGEPSVTAAQSYELMELAQIAAADPPALTWLRSRDRIGAEWPRRLSEDSPFRLAFAQFIERYGHRGVYESHLRNPRWREAPDYLLDSVVQLIGCDPAQRRERQQEAARQARTRLDAALPIWLRLLTGMLIRFSVIERNLREAGRSALMAYLEPIRRDVLALGRRWAGREAGQGRVLEVAPVAPGRLLEAAPGRSPEPTLERPEDIFNLTLAEVLAVAEDRLPAAAACARSRWRRRQLERWASELEPDVIIEDDAERPAAPIQPPIGSRSTIGTPPAWAPSAPASSDDVWHGTVAGSGRARGAAYIARHPTEALAMEAGAVLVAPSTDPSWTPQFLKAAALVMEMGGYLSHGAIVARELGIPAVVNLPGILRQLRSGDVLEVDGNHGIVRRLRSRTSSE